jgi:hypothetical protein
MKAVAKIQTHGEYRKFLKPLLEHVKSWGVDPSAWTFRKTTSLQLTTPISMLANEEDIQDILALFAQEDEQTTEEASDDSEGNAVQEMAAVRLEGTRSAEVPSSTSANERAVERSLSTCSTGRCCRVCTNSV